MLPIDEHERISASRVPPVRGTTDVENGEAREWSPRVAAGRARTGAERVPQNLSGSAMGLRRGAAGGYGSGVAPSARRAAHRLRADVSVGGVHASDWCRARRARRAVARVARASERRLVFEPVGGRGALGAGADVRDSIRRFGSSAASAPDDLHVCAGDILRQIITVEGGRACHNLRSTMVIRSPPGGGGVTGARDRPDKPTLFRVLPAGSGGMTPRSSPRSLARSTVSRCGG